MSAAVAQAIRGMMAAGFTLEQALVAIEKIDEAKRGSAKTNAERQAEFRARQKAARNDVTSNERNVTFVTPSRDIQNAHTHAEPEPNKTTSSPVQKDILTDIPKVSIAKPSCDDLGFTETWVAYPRRQGGNSRKNAEARYRKAVKSGVDPADILAGVLAYAAHCDATGKTGTEFVKTAEAWLNGRFWESDWSISLSRPPPPRQASNRRSLIDALHRTIPDEQPDQQFYPRLAFGG